MFTIAVITLFFIASAIFSFLDTEKNRTVVIVYVVLSFFLFLISGLKPIGIDNDSDAYVRYFYNASSDGVELSFVFIANTLNALFVGPQALFVIYAALSIPLKSYSIFKQTDFWFLSMVVWLSRYFVLHDMTQIRVAVASSIFLYSIQYLANGEKKKYLFCCCLAAFFHYSAFVLFPLTCMGNKTLNIKWKYFLFILPLMGYMLSSLHINLFSLIPFPYVQEKIAVYEKARDMGFMGMDEINIFNPMYLIRLLLYYILLWKYDVIKNETNNLSILLKVFALSYICYTVFSFIPVVAFRVSELYGIVEILLLPYIINVVTPKWVGKLLVILLFSYIYYLTIFANELLSFA